MSSSDKCAQCKELASKRCAKCHNANGESVYYCSKECQHKNWTSHKHFCGIALPCNVIPEGKRTSRGILLPVDGTKPIFVDVPVGACTEDPFLFTPSIDKEGELFYSDRRFLNRSWRSRQLFGHMLNFVFRDSFIKDGSKLNQCVQTLTNGKAPFQWRGPILVLKYTDDTNEEPLDVKLKDASDIVDQFLFYGAQEQK
ncbi:MYND finger domain-containing protein [Ditylenchus destructor]|uniref:MYND finger domain-containing protein n=1 Tax=Ditylenchus destructor TaxID=166010 RepID=A0AAD4MNV0_9BILA|nr:MYND finger domain-containing protein [Ditylenchus destructor]